MKDSNTFTSYSKYPNSQNIVKKYTKITNSFDDLYTILLNDSDCIKTKIKTLADGNDVIKAVFRLYDGDKEFTFYKNGGFNGFGGHSGKWYKFMSKEEWVIYSSAKEWIDSCTNSITSYAPHYYENIEMKCGKDIFYFCKDTQTMLLILELMNKYKLNELPFERWHERLNIDISWKKTHRCFTWSDLYDYLIVYGCYRKISIVGERMFNCNNKKRYKALINMFDTKIKNNKRKFEKNREIYNDEFFPLLCRLYNPQIYNKNIIAYRIYRELEQGNWRTDLLKNSNKEFNSKGWNKRQLEIYKTLKIKDIICSSSNSKLKQKFFNSYNKLNSMKLWMLEIKNEFYSDLINNNFELSKINEFKEISEINKNKEYKKYSLNTFNRVCKSSRTVFIKQKNGTLRRYNTYENYLNARPYFNKIA